MDLFKATLIRKCSLQSFINKVESNKGAKSSVQEI